MEKEVWRKELGLSFPSAHRVSRNRYIRLRYFHSIRNAITGFDSLICEGTKMTKCNRKKQLLGKSIRNVRMRRNMTQRELANAIEGIGESALRSYELGERSPKQDDSFFKPRRRRKVRCTETGVVYESIKDAAERTKISPNGIGSAASGMAGGYHWEYADD